MPEPLAKTQSLPVRFTDSVEKSRIKHAISEIIESL
jgi:hypothetical protein